MSTGTSGQGQTVTGGDGTPGGPPASTAQRLLDFGGAYAIAIFHLVAVMIGLAIIGFSRVDHLSTALLWALACLASGGMIGFLFGIPRALQQPTAPRQPATTPQDPAQTGGDPAADRRGASVLEVNTNLEQISDWLTKIIVGIGLVELRNVPAYVRRIADFMATGVGAQAESKTIIVASLAYFSVVGFIGAYLLTRTYLSKVIKEYDRLTLSSNDITVPVGGVNLPLTEVSLQIRNSVADLREQILKLHPDLLSKVQAATPAMAPVAGPQPPRSVLWVDDRPDNNRIAVEDLKRMNITVDTARSTAEALKLLETRSYGAVISDMLRVEGGVSRPKAGIELLEAVHKVKSELPFVIYCGPENARANKDLESPSPRVVVTSSRTELDAALNEIL